MKRLTNRQIIAELLPVMKKARERWEQGEIKFTSLDYYKHPCYVEGFYGGEVRFTKYGENFIVISVTKYLQGKYDHATLNYKIGNDGYGYEKEYTGMGNGFYADVDFSGKIIRSEWD